jgi:hypothetical protein
MKNLVNTLAALFFGLIFSSMAMAMCPEAPINGVYYTSSFCWMDDIGHAWIPLKSEHDDTERLQRAINKAKGKLVFDEANYWITDELIVHEDLILEGTGRARNAPVPVPSPTPMGGPTPETNLSTKITQWSDGKAIFRIKQETWSISIRDMTLLAGGPDKSGTIGIYASPDTKDSNVNNDLSFEFVNLTFINLDQGIFFNAPAYSTMSEGEWQADHVRLDHAFFQNCRIGIHINSMNSGWSMSSLDFVIPVDPDIKQSGIDNDSWGIVLERSAYTNINLAIGNGNMAGDCDNPRSSRCELPSGFIWIKQHVNVTVQNTVDENFHYSLYIGDPGLPYLDLRNDPINLTNNHFNNDVYANHATLVSVANQYGSENHPIKTDIYGTSVVTSIGDKFCFEGVTCEVSSVDYSNFLLHDTSKFLLSSTKDRAFIGTDLLSPLNITGEWTSDPLLSVISQNAVGDSIFRIGRTLYWYDFTRSEVDGALEIKGNQTGYNAVRFVMDSGTKVQINTDGSVTYGSMNFSTLSGNTKPVGTVIYCSDCAKSTPCTGSGTGALAKRVGTSVIWDCD